jgi:hypothetical protein
MCPSSMYIRDIYFQASLLHISRRSSLTPKQINPIKYVPRVSILDNIFVMYLKFSGYFTRLESKCLYVAK